MRISQTAAGTVIVVGALTMTLTALIYPSMLGVQTVSSAPSRVVANTPAGPLTEADRDFVVKVRAAGLWELPAGELALKKAAAPAVRTAGAHLVNGHANLDAADRKVAAELGITIPNQPSPQQQGFVTTLTNDTGRKFDQDLANILRLTHGQFFTVIASIRATTKNTLVRELADVANNIVLDHITVLEQTGLVDFDSLVFQEMTPPKLPKSQLNPPTPQPGEPTVVLSPPAGFTPPPPTTPSAG